MKFPLGIVKAKAAAFGPEYGVMAKPLQERRPSLTKV
jgi:hypothetical protein